MKKAAVGLGILAVVLLVVFGGSFVSRRNEMVTLKENIKGAWAQVDTVIQRRADLIPNLVNTVKGYAAHEQKVLEDLSNARAQLAGARNPSERIAANTQLEGALSRLLVVVENYPNLKADQQFLRLQDELAGTENRIAVERRRYNGAVQTYNTTIQTFPNSLVASISGFQREDAYIKAEGAAREVPKVDFSK
ncbi:MAG TPA: LemA family protein [Terriglobia bacterium]|jgi:LemA protein|nr:LemA family protein [Terriglobia bacterium]